jgi:hypothetical protein
MGIGDADGLPAQATALVGRDSAITAAGTQLLSTHCRLLTLTGPPGVGKTRLAIAVAESVADRFADGVHFVDLGETYDVGSVIPSVAAALGAPEALKHNAIADIRGSIVRPERLLHRLGEAGRFRFPPLAPKSRFAQQLACLGQRCLE